MEEKQKPKLSDYPPAFIPDGYTREDFWKAKMPDFKSWILYDLSGEKIKVYSGRNLSALEKDDIVRSLWEGRNSSI
ncbi:MAG: hypothetical protein AABX48_04340 [Nanoarchaeota archaeon]